MTQREDDAKTSVTHNLKNETPYILVGSLILIAGLAWNEAFKTLIDYIAPASLTSRHVWYKIIYAALLTVVIVFVITGIQKIHRRINGLDQIQN
jgi:hypothetical protein